MPLNGALYAQIVMSFTNVRLTNLEIAEIQLNRALKLFLNEKDYISALTLAGAAEEILGKMIEKNGETNSFKEAIQQSNKLIEKFGGEPVPENKAGPLFNYYRNRLKHYMDNEPIGFSADYFSAEIIIRAAKNYIKLTNKENELISEFKKAIYKWNLW